MEPQLWQYGGGLQTVMELPDIILTTDLTVHPTEGWPVVGAIQWSGNREPERAFVRALNPEAGVWDVAQNVDLGASGVGRRFRSMAVGVTLDRTVHAAWGSPDFPRLGVWASSSRDFGRTWSAPQQIAPGCMFVLDLAASLDNRLVALAVCPVDQRSVDLAVIVRNADGVWGEPERVAAPVWYASDGSVQVIGEGPDARIVLLATGNANSPATIYLLSRPLDGGAWERQQRTIAVGGAEVGALPWRVRSTSFTRPDGSTGLLFAFGVRGTAGVFALTSLDGGRSWGEIRPIAFDGAEQSGRWLDRAVPAYDPEADRFAAVWACCADAAWAVVPSTLYGSWSRPDGHWQPPQGPGEYAPRVPLRLGMDSAVSSLVGAQAHNGRLVWLAWVEGSSRVVARALDLNQIIPVAEYPPATPRPTRPGGRP
jgi:hypothetical protein